MAKTRTLITVDPVDICYTVVVHEGNPGWWDPTALHVIYGYSVVDLPFGVTGWHFHDTIEEALAEARTWAAMPSIATDICTACRLSAPGPGVPRWNIYRGQDKPILPMTYFWDWWDGPPPGW